MESAVPNVSRIIDKMYEHDFFSQWLGVERLEEKAGFCQLKMKVRKEMLNGFGIAHGGITFSFADSAFAFASNSQGRHAVSIETAISHFLSVQEGDVLIATAREVQKNHRIGTYLVEIKNQSEVLVALFKGTVYRKSEEW